MIAVCECFTSVASPVLCSFDSSLESHQPAVNESMSCISRISRRSRRALAALRGCGPPSPPCARPPAAARGNDDEL